MDPIEIFQCRCGGKQERFGLFVNEAGISAQYKCDSCFEYARYWNGEYSHISKYNHIYSPKIPEIIEFEEIPKIVTLTKHEIILGRIKIYEKLIERLNYESDKTVLRELKHLANVI